MAEAFQPPAQIKPDQIFEIIVRRRWFIVIPLCITLTLGLFATLVAQKTYQASTLILVQQQSVPTAYVKSVVTSSINQRISTISQQILSRSNLEKIIDQFGLYENSGNMYMEDKIASMRNRVQVKTEKTRQGAKAFSIIFKGNDPQKVMRIANTLASFFMDENLKVREAQAIGTSEFLESELEKTKHRLEKRERKLAEYRSRYLGGLPDELETNLRTLDRLQEQLANKHTMLRETKMSLSLLETQIAQARKASSKSHQTLVFLGDEENGVDGTPTEAGLFLAEKQHAELLGSYTQKHPDVVRLEKRIENLKTTLAQERAETQKHNPANPGQPSDNMEDGAIGQMKISRSQQINDIKQIKFDIQEIEKKMLVYQTRVEDTPKRELELQSLKRDYNNIRDVFNSLLDRKLEAELSVNMEKKQKGEQFRILDHARLPEKPISPNVKKFFMLSVVAGLGLGAGMIFLLEFFDTSLRRDEQIEDELGLTILASIPLLQVPIDKTKGRIEIIGFGLVSIYTIIVLSFFAVLNIKGLDRTINFIKMHINF
jgi:protein tyrosine kinase modulator